MKKRRQSVFGEQLQNDFNTQISLLRIDAFGIQKPFDVGRCRIRSIQLGERRRNEEGIWFSKIKWFVQNNGK